MEIKRSKCCKAVIISKEWCSKCDKKAVPYTEEPKQVLTEKPCKGCGIIHPVRYFGKDGRGTYKASCKIYYNQANIRRYHQKKLNQTLT